MLSSWTGYIAVKILRVKKSQYNEIALSLQTV